MSDKTGVYSSSILLRTGKGRLVKIHITNSSLSATATATFYDNTAGSGTKIFEAHVSGSRPVNVSLPESQALYFATGLYLSLGSGLTATVWWREY
jgi:hypothetical protein